MNLFHLFQDQYGACYDDPDPRDFSAEEMFGTIKPEKIPEQKDLREPTNYEPKNQGRSVKCTAFGVTSAFQIQNMREHASKIIFNPDYLWDYMKSRGWTSKNGASLQSALKALIKIGMPHNDGLQYYAKGYAKCEKTFDSIVNQISIGFPVYTGGIVTKTNFKNAKKDGAWTGNDGARVTGHAFFLCGYAKFTDGPYKGVRALQAINSYGNWGMYGDGSFWILEKHINDLYTPYIIYDKIDLERVFADVTENAWYYEAVKKFSKLGVAKGEASDTVTDPKDRKFFPNRAITRAEFLVMLDRYDKLK